MILKPLGNFTGNGVLKGTIVAYDDSGEPLGWEIQGNWSSLRFREDAAVDMASNTGISTDKAKAMIAQILKVARKETNTCVEEVAPEKRVIKAVFPNLVDIVSSRDGTPSFLFLENGALVTRKEFNEGGLLYVPPEPEHMPYLLPSEEGVRYAFKNDDNASVFCALMPRHKKASKLAGEHHYYLVVLYDFHTYLACRANYSPYLVFQTIDAERGKTRQGCSVAWVAYRGIVTETLQEANLFRWADSLACTLFFDVRDIIAKAERRG